MLVGAFACCLTFFLFLSLFFPLFSQFTTSPSPSYNTLFYFYLDFNTNFLFHQLTRTYTHTHTLRWRPGAQWRFSRKALLHVLNSSWDSVEEQGWGPVFVFCSATGRRRRPVETSAGSGGGRSLEKRSFVGRDTVFRCHQIFHWIAGITKSMQHLF